MSGPPSHLVQTIRAIDLTAPPADVAYVSRGDARLEQLIFMLESGERPRILLHGPVGVGKSTELARWTQQLAPVAHAVLVDLSKQTRTLLGSSDRSAPGNPAAPRASGGGWSERARATTYLIELGLRTSLAALANAEAERLCATPAPDLSAAVQTTDLAASLRDVAAELVIEDGRAGYFSGLFGPLVHQLQGLLTRPLLALIDGLDLLPVDLVGELIGPGSPLANPDWPGVLYVVPHALISTQSSVDRDVGFRDEWHVPPFAIFAERPARGISANTRSRRAPIDEEVVGRLVEALQTRLHDERVMSDIDANLRDIVVHGGGVPRDMLRILRSAGMEALQAGQINHVHVGKGVRDLRVDLEKACRGTPISELREIFELGHHRGHLDLIARNVVLGYEQADGRVWLPHPVLWSLLGLDA